MFYDAVQNRHGLRHDPFKALIVPRPIGWISSVSANGICNLAPYSFFNAVSEKPAYFVFGSAGLKDSIVNIEETGEFVCSLATDDLREHMNMTSAAVPPDVDEFPLAGLTAARSELVRPPRVKEAAAAFECRHWKTIVHRLDKDTSGLIVVAKTDAAHKGLAVQFASHGADGRLQRAYLAVVWGALVRPAGSVDLPLSRSATNRTKIAVARGSEGRRAVTHYRVEETYQAANASRRRGPRGAKPVQVEQPVASLVRLELETGRTHQIRVHMAALGHPLLGDAVYGTGYSTRASRLAPEAAEALAALGRQALHATLLGFEHPVTGARLAFESPPPADLAELISALRGAVSS